MTRFPIHDSGSAPEEARGVLAAMRQKYTFDLNLFGGMATSPTALKAYTGLNEIFAKSSLSPVEQQVVLMTVSKSNGCDYCMAAHSTGMKMMKAGDDVIAALRAGTVIADARLEALRVFTGQMVEQRGDVREADVTTFLAAGYTPENVLEVIVGTALKTLSNYANHIMKTPLDEAFTPQAWSPTDGGA